MKLRNVTVVALSALMLQACAGLKSPEPMNTLSLNELSKTLNVYPDNRIGYTISSEFRVWSNDNIILALKFKNRLINAKDIEFVTASDPENKRWYKRITVQLKSGEKLVADFANYKAYETGGGGWVACMPNKTCADLVRDSSGSPTDFPGFPHFLTSANIRQIEMLGDYLAINGGANKIPDKMLSNNSWPLPSFVADYYTLSFSEYKEISDVQSLLQAARQRRKDSMERDKIWRRAYGTHY